MKEIQKILNNIKKKVFKIIYYIILFIREIYIYFFKAIYYLVKYKRSLFNWIENYKSYLIFILLKFSINLLFFKLFYLFSRIICIINLFIFIIKLDMFKIIKYLKKLWIFALLFLFGYYPITSLILTLFWILVIIYPSIFNSFLNYKGNNISRLIYKILCVWDKKIVLKIKTLKTEIRKVYIKDINKLLHKLK